MSAKQYSQKVAMSKLLVIEDDPRIQKALQRQFVAEGFNVCIAGDGREGLAAAKAQKPDAVILDLMLPGMSGREVCKGIRAIAPGIPVLILSAVSEVADKVLLLELGADDYVTKPFSPRELLARLQAAVRRTRRSERSDILSFGNITADFAKMEVSKDGQPVVMTAHELKLLKYFLDHA